MKQSMPKLFSFALTLALIVSFLPAQVQAAGGGSGSISLTTLGSAYTQDFNTLANTGTTNTLTINGWYLDEQGTSSANNGQYAAGTGSNNAGDTYSFGAATNTERAFGGLLSGTLTPTIGASFTNGTGSTITSLDIAYYGEEWRLGATGRLDRLEFQYSTDATSLTTGTWSPFFPLNFVTPDTAGSTGAKNGNAATDRTAISASIPSLTILNGATFWIRWNDYNPSGSDDGLAVDDFSITPQSGVSTNPSGTPASTPYSVPVGANTLLTVAVVPGTLPASTNLAVTCDLSSLGGSVSQTFYDDGTNGDGTAADNTFSFLTTVADTTTPGAKSAACSIKDAEARTGSATIALTVTSVVIIPIGTVNGAISNTTDAPKHNADKVDQAVTVRGVIYEKTLAATDWGGAYYAFFIQNTAATRDANLNTSDGLYVFMSIKSSMPAKSGSYTPTVGDEIVVSGTVTEYFNMTELTNPTLIGTVVRSGVDLNAELPPAVANPPANLDDANRYWERLQGMRVQVPQNSIVLGGRNVFSPADAEIWLARSDSTIATRSGPYDGIHSYDSFTRRAFRDASILDDNFDPNNWDGNGYRILMGSLGIKGTADDAQVLIDPARTFDTVTNSPAGGLNYTFSKYRIEITEQPIFSEGVDPATNYPVQAVADRGTAYSIADYNLENLYDFRNNPFSGCDFAGDSGCSQVTPFRSDVTPPYDYVPASNAIYQARLNDISLQIINDLHNPDILMVQEVENQDFCKLDNGAMVCGAGNNDGKPDVLQDLALKIAANGGPEYDSAFDSDSSDLRGILPAFLYRTDRVQLVSPVGNPIFSSNPVIGSYTSVPYDGDMSNPKTLNAVYSGSGACETDWIFPRAPDVALFRISSTNIGGGFQDVYVINNHFKSGPDTCVAHRTEQAKYNAALVAYIQSYNPVARIVVGGDLNVYPKPDNTSYGAPFQLASLYDTNLSLTNLWDVINGTAPASAYSYVYLGMAQTLDQMFINKPMMADLQDFHIAHINSDFPAEYPAPGDVARGTSDHDPNVATFGINFNGLFQPIANTPTFNLASAGNAIPVKFSLFGDKGLKIFAPGYPLSKQIACDVGNDENTISETVTPGKNQSLSYDALTDQYTYIWKTDKGWAGTCRMLVLELKDGTGQIAFFQFK